MNKLIRNIPNDICSTILPSLEEIKEHLKVSEDGWLLSRHPFCDSCHELYKKNCKEIERYFNIKSQGLTTDIEQIRKQLNILISSPNYKNKDYINELETVIRLYISCISSRLYHHNICFVLNENNNLINTNVVKTNINHNYFLKELCVHVKLLYLNYKTSIQNYNMMHKSKMMDVLYNENILNICRNIIKQFGDEDDKEYINDIFQTKTSVSLNCKQSPIKKYRKNKQSRVAKGYRISKKLIENLIENTHLSKHSPCKGPFVPPPKYPKYKDFQSYLY